MTAEILAIEDTSASANRIVTSVKRIVTSVLGSDSPEV